MPHKSERHQLKKQLERKFSGAYNENDPNNENMSRIITFGSMPSYREDKMQEMKRQKDSRKESQTEVEPQIDQTSQFIELSPNNLSKMSHSYVPEKGILKHIPGGSVGPGGGTPEANHKERWTDLTQSDNQENHQKNDALSEVERTLKSLNGYHEEILEALHSVSSNRPIDIGRPSPNSDAAKKAFLDSIPEYGGINRLRSITLSPLLSLSLSPLSLSPLSLSFSSLFLSITNSVFVVLESAIFRKQNTVDPVYSERVGAAKSVHLRRVFTINVFNLTIN
jgi:hypothetical protein